MSRSSRHICIQTIHWKLSIVPQVHQRGARSISEPCAYRMGLSTVVVSQAMNNATKDVPYIRSISSFHSTFREVFRSAVDPTEL